MMASALRWIGFLFGLSSLLLVQGCREEEQDQILIHEKGVYQGQQEAPLGPDRLQELRSRASIQKF